MEPPINFNTNTGFGLPHAFAAITHEVMPFSLSFGEMGWGWGGRGASRPLGVCVLHGSGQGVYFRESTCPLEFSFSPSFHQKF